MHHWSGFFAAVFLWLALMTVCGAYVLRIAGLLFRQHRAERYYRHRLAAARGATVRQPPSDEGSTPGAPRGIA
ncbi:MAG: hypothetical protein E6K81_02650 [Candidatus Eisenbacteria bacterium]|uniref:CcmD family protein n=1 Tax=Eiseniibacteriota bacterium TaxID=2212470 RepID=A0A538UD51_UNCEI|nr:MAG: hypothetical protein E6K81_02650 [Candidatus Eisenbacteria bacterium]